MRPLIGMVLAAIFVVAMPYDFIENRNIKLEKLESIKFGEKKPIDEMLYSIGLKLRFVNDAEAVGNCKSPKKLCDCGTSWTCCSSNQKCDCSNEAYCNG